ncbi:hypothetical protein [Flavobacterium sp.]|jgi:DNA-binding MarR family transcriptional regulator|uniref:hypothetical protein n=1 Tax=Flavobacterium sp. TaxID=239 RepID=UPI0037BEDFFA
MNKYTAIISFIANMSEQSRGCDEILSHVYNNDRQGVSTKITDLVYQRNFGTGPTVHSKIKKLARQKFIELKKSKEDARVKEIIVTSKGLTYLRGQDSQIEKMLGALA